MGIQYHTPGGKILNRLKNTKMLSVRIPNSVERFTLPEKKCGSSQVIELKSFDNNIACSTFELPLLETDLPEFVVAAAA